MKEWGILLPAVPPDICLAVTHGANCILLKKVETKRAMQIGIKGICLSALNVSNCMLHLNAIFYLAMKKNYGL